MLWDLWERPSLVAPHGCPGVFCARALNSTVQPGAACGAVPPLVACKRKKKWRPLWRFLIFCFMQMQSHPTQVLPEHLRMSPGCLWHQLPTPDLWMDNVAQTSPAWGTSTGSSKLERLSQMPPVPRRTGKGKFEWIWHTLDTAQEMELKGVKAQLWGSLGTAPFSSHKL